jgi:cell division protein FtsZ
MNLELSLPDQGDELRPRITVIGVGGAGGNAVNNMIRSNLTGVEFMAANTDSQALRLNQADHKIQLGLNISHGLGAGSRPDIGRAAAEEALDDILAALDGCHMVFITAGMGGGTGTGAAPVIARAAREHGILTVGVVTKPFHFEGRHRMRTAEAGIEELASYVDTLIVIPNQNLFRIASDKTTFADAFHLADDVLHSGVRGVTDLMVKPGLINLDFADIRAVMREMGKAMMGTGEATGADRAVKAAEAAISNPLLDDASMKGARGVLINITGGVDMTLFEVDEAANRIRDEVDPEANIIFGATSDDSIDGIIRVSVVATGIDGTGTIQQPSYAVSAPEAAPALAVAEEVSLEPTSLAADSEDQDAPLELKPSEEALAAATAHEHMLNGLAAGQELPGQPTMAVSAEQAANGLSHGANGAHEGAQNHEPPVRRKSLWSIFSGNGSGKGEKADNADGRRSGASTRDDMFVAAPPAVVQREIQANESSVRPLPPEPVASAKPVPNAPGMPLAAHPDSAISTASVKPPLAGATPTPEGVQEPYAYAEDVLEIPAFLRRQAN